MVREHVAKVRVKTHGNARAARSRPGAIGGAL
jgi:hypothetical protein